MSIPLLNFLVEVIFMAAAPSSLPSSKETTNYARLCRLLVDVGSQVLRSTFDKVHPPATLHTVLGSTSVHYPTLQSLYSGKKKVLNPTQWGKLYPAHSPVSSATFDITLLTVLLRNICGLGPPANGWDRLPPPTNISIADDIARVKYYRNTVYGHASQAAVDDISFSAYWQEIREALVRLGGANLRADINNLEHDCMDPDIEEHYRELMEQWKKDDDSIKNKLDEMEANIKDVMQKMVSLKADIERNLRETTGKIESEMKEVKDKLASLTASVEKCIDITGKIESEMKEMREKLGFLTASVEKSTAEGVFDPSELIDGIRRMYVTREGWLSPFPWCEEFQFFVGDIFTWLKVVRRRKTRGEVTDQPITMSSLLHPHEECSEPRTVLIEGKPGIGKTTYCMKYVYDWATKKLNPQKCFPSIKAVLFLKCRDFKSDIWEVIDDQLLPEDVEEGVKQQFFQFILANQSSILLILDGLDELPASKAPVISKLVTGKVLPECYIVATTRHEAGIKLRKCCHTLLEVEGFTKKHASEFIAKYFKGKSELAEKLLARISKDKNLQEMCANPLNAALLCLLCEEVCGTLPENRTKLYLNMIECVLRRYRKKTELPDTEEDLTNLYKPQLKTLGLIALNGLIEDKLDFEVNELGNHANEIAAFGFLSVHPGGSKLRRSLRYAFLHKSFQECFAAFHLCCEIQDKQTSPEELVSDDKYSLDLTQVLLFLCGILADQSDQEAAALVSSLGNRFNNLASKNCRSVQFLLEAINECKREKGDFHLKLARCFGDSLNQKHLYVECQFLSEGLAIILSEVIKANATLITLGLCFGCISDSGATSIAKAIKVNNTLTSLDLSNNRISDAGATSIAEAIKVNKNLTHLKLFGNGISDAGATSIAGVIKVNETLTSLDLSNNRISDTGATSTAEAIKVNKTLTYLNLSNNRISDAGATSTAQTIKVNKTLTYLDLSDNRISDVGAISIAEAIEVNKTLTHLKLSGNGISDAGATSIAFAIKINNTLSHLNLSFNCISDAGATSLAEAVKVNQTLTFLNLSKNRSSNAGASSIAEAIKDNKTLTNVNLSRNGISDAGAKSIAEAIKINKTLTYLNLSFNGISDAGGTCIAEAIKVSKILTHLNLFGNGISDAGAMSSAEAVRVNRTLTSLHLFTNPFL